MLIIRAISKHNELLIFCIWNLIHTLNGESTILRRDREGYLPKKARCEKACVKDKIIGGDLRNHPVPGEYETGRAFSSE